MLAKVIIENGVKKIQALTADTGTGAPVGSYLYLEKKSNPQGYLYCDGSTFDETKYPLLYAYLGSNVLPDWREFSAVGAEENTTDVYNASTNPTGTIHAHDIFTEGEAKDDQLQDHRHELPSTKGSGIYSGVAVTDGTGGAVANKDTDSAKYARTGNVTRGKRKAVFIYIKATSGLSENAQDNVINTLNEQRSYSTVEHLTGRKWIDGKPTYEKTIAEDVTQSDSWDLSTLNIADIIEIKGLAYGTNDQYIGWFPINGSMLTSQPSSNTNFVRLLLTHNHNLVLQVYGAGSGATQLNVTKVRITLEYTKTID